MNEVWSLRTLNRSYALWHRRELFSTLLFTWLFRSKIHSLGIPIKCMSFNVFCVNYSLLETKRFQKLLYLRVSESFIAHMMRIYDETPRLQTNSKSWSTQATLKGSIVPMSGFSYNVWYNPNNFDTRHKIFITMISNDRRSNYSWNSP